MSIRRMCELLTTVTIAGVIYSGCLAPAEAQNATCATRPFGDNSNACASTAFVQSAISGLIAIPNHSVALGTGSNSLSSVGPAVSGAALLSNGVLADPTWTLTPIWRGKHTWQLSSLDPALYTSQTLTGTASAGQYYANLINLADTADSSGTSVSGNMGLFVQQAFGGGSTKGNKLAIYGSVTNSLGVTTNIGANYVALTGAAFAVGPDGGTNTGAGANGSFFGSNPLVVASNGATNLLLVAGEEVNVAMQTGSSTNSKVGIQIVQGATDAVSGAVIDAALRIANQVGAVGWNYGILFDKAHAPGLKSTGIAIGSTDSWTLDTVIDFSSATVTTNYLKFSGWVLGSNGIITSDVAAAPSSPAAGKVAYWVDSTDLRFHDKNTSGTIGTTVVADTGTANNFLTAVSTAGVISKARPTCGNLSDSSTGCTTTVGTIATQNANAAAITGGTITGLTGLAIRDTSAAFDVTLAATSSSALTAGRALTFDMGNVAHTLAFGTTANTITFPNAASDTVTMIAASQELTNKTLNASVGKGTWTASGTWTLPAFTLGGTVSGGNNQINNVVIGASTPRAGSFTTIANSSTITNTVSTTAGVGGLNSFVTQTQANAEFTNDSAASMTWIISANTATNELLGVPFGLTAVNNLTGGGALQNVRMFNLAFATNASTQTDTAQYLYIGDSTTSGTVTTGYGVYIASLQGTTKYGIYDASGGIWKTTSTVASTSTSTGSIVTGGGVGAGGAGYFGGNVNTAGVFAVGASTGTSATKTVRDSAGTGTCTLIFTGGILTGGTC